MSTRLAVVAVAMVVVVVAAGCMAHIHRVGNGAQTGAAMAERQWYILWGIIPLNNVDTNAMAGGAADYTIKTWVSPIDFIINIFTGYVTIYSRSVEVTK